MIRISLNPTLAGFIRKELIQTLRDPRMRFFLFVTPAIQMTMFGVAISNEVKNLKIAARFDDRDTVMRDLYERAIASGWFVPARVSPSQLREDPFQLVRSGQADVVLIPPPQGLTHELGRGTAPLQALIDATNVTQAQASEAYLATIARDVVANDLRLDPKPQPISFDIRVLYNPSLDTALFMVPGVMCMLMVMTTMILCMTAITREKEMGTFEMLISAPIRPSEIILGKTVPFVLVGMANLPITLGIGMVLFGVPLRGSLLLLTGAAFIFVCTSVAIGTLVSTICRNQQQANLASFLFLFPAIMFSGVIFPVENMPRYLTGFAYIDPLYHYLAILRNILLKGGDVQFVASHVVVLTVLGALAVWASFRRFHTTLQ